MSLFIMKNIKPYSNGANAKIKNGKLGMLSPVLVFISGATKKPMTPIMEKGIVNSANAKAITLLVWCDEKDFIWTFIFPP